MRKTLLLLPVLLSAALTACGSTAPPSQSPDGPPSKAAAAAPEESAASPALLAFGRPLAWQRKDGSGRGTAKVFGYRQSAASGDSAGDGKGKDGSVWAALDIEVCAESGSVTATGSDWSLLYADGTAVAPSETERDVFPRPRFPVETQVRAGECTRGEVVYSVPADRRPTRIHYAATMDTGDMRPPASDGWAVPKATGTPRP
ncbi:hypothetical protein [Streptomyces sp. NPDC059788]|uniref:hypothetical protein n=1 Tax=Streptomyces sp. NPDC059788 TaxID=3346948 RepID=UPI0036629E74